MAEASSILIVDDQPLNIKILKSILSSDEYIIHTVNDGPAALDLMESQTFDLILLDIQMPKMDGYEVCRRIKALPRGASIPVIFLSAMNEPNDIIKGFEAGGVDYVSTPFNVAELRARVQTQVALSQARGKESALVKDLQESNAELGRLIYTVSHDLKSPLHSIVGYAGYIAKDLGESKNIERALKDSIKIQEVATKAMVFIEDLLNVSRAKGRKNEFSTFSMKELLDELLLEIRPEIEKVSAVFEWGPQWPRVSSDRNKIHEVWQNLIQNALKYRHPEINPLLKLNAKLENKEWVFSLEDNGLGISKENLTNVFNLFEKVDPKSSGSGVGLAIVKKTLDALGGRVWVTSPGLLKGSTFYFTLPET